MESCHSTESPPTPYGALSNYSARMKTLELDITSNRIDLRMFSDTAADQIKLAGLVNQFARWQWASHDEYGLLRKVRSLPTWEIPMDSKYLIEWAQALAHITKKYGLDEPERIKRAISGEDAFNLLPPGTVWASQPPRVFALCLTLMKNLTAGKRYLKGKEKNKQQETNLPPKDDNNR